MKFIKGQSPKSGLGIGEPILAKLDFYKKVLDDLGFEKADILYIPTAKKQIPYFVCRSDKNNKSRLSIEIEEGKYRVGATRGYYPQNSVIFKAEYEDTKTIEDFFAGPAILDKFKYD